jgi:hypothetical protein
MPKTPPHQFEPLLLPDASLMTRPEQRTAPMTRDETHEAINDLFHRAMKHNNAKQWMKGLLTFIAGMRRYSIFTAKLIYVQRPGAVAVGTPHYWFKHRRSVRPGAMPIVILVPRGPFSLVYEYEDTEGPTPQQPLTLFAATGNVSTADWDRLKRAVERDGKTRQENSIFRVEETGLGHGRAGDVQHRRDANGRFVVRINANLDAPSRWATLVHEVGHVYCGHCGRHERGWWSDRRTLPGLHPSMQDDIREFEAEAVAWIVASRADIETNSVEYLAAKVAPLDNERVDIDAVLQAANHIESIAPTTALRGFRADEQR